MRYPVVTRMATAAVGDLTVTPDQIAERIRSAMGAQRISNAALARRVGMTATAMHRRTRGQCSITVEELVSIAAVLDVPITDLIPSPRSEAS